MVDVVDAGLAADTYPRSPTRPTKTLLVVAACLCVAGCAGVVRVAYNNSDFALRMMADRYFDLQSEQEDYLQKQLAHFHEWHRREELPIYARTLSGAADRIKRGVQREDVAWAVGEVRERYRALLVQAIEDGGPVLATLKAENLQALEKKLAADNAKFANEYP